MRAILIFFCLCSPALAIVPPEYDDPIDPWQSAIEFGWMYDRSNKTTNTLNSLLEIDYDAEQAFSGRAVYNFDYASDDGQAYTRKGRLQLQGDYSLSKSSYLFIRTDLKKYKYATFARENTYTSGYGHEFIDKRWQKFSLEFGPGYRSAYPQKNLPDQSNKEEGIIRNVLKYQQFFNNSMRFYIDTSLEIGLKNTVSIVEAKLENKIMHDLSLVFNVSNTHTKNVPDGGVHNEISNKVNIRYLF